MPGSWKIWAEKRTGRETSTVWAEYEWWYGYGWNCRIPIDDSRKLMPWSHNYPGRFRNNWCCKFHSPYRRWKSWWIDCWPGKCGTISLSRCRGRKCCTTSDRSAWERHRKIRPLQAVVPYEIWPAVPPAIIHRICPNKRPGRLIFSSNEKDSRTHQKPSVLCTPPFEKSSIIIHRFCVLPPLESHGQDLVRSFWTFVF